MPLFKKTFLLLTLASVACLGVPSYAHQYYMISSDSNNCKVHWHAKRPYITGSDCLCMHIDAQHADDEWTTVFSGEPRCVLTHRIRGRSAMHAALKPATCYPGDHCDQFQCLQLLYEDNSTHPMSKAIVDDAQCVALENENGKAKYVPLPHCSANGIC